MKMRVFELKSLLLSLLLIAATGFSLHAQDARKEYSESYNISRGTTLSTDTKYSHVSLLTWDKDAVEILAVVEVKASSDAKAQEALEKVEVKIGQSGNIVSLSTEFDDGWSRNVQTRIDITVSVPSYINLEVDNSYGDLFIQEISGLALLDLKYSNFKADILSRGNENPVNRLDLAYSNGTIGKAGRMDLNLAYSELEITSSDMLNMESKYSKLSGEKAGSIQTEGAYDKYFFDEIGSFSAALKYSGLKFGILRKGLQLESSYTNVSIGSLSGGFDKLDASLSYGNIEVDVEEGASFKLEAESKYGKVNVAQEGKLNRMKESATMKVSGSVGSNPRAEMNLITRYGNIDIR
ncbi:MAG: hypothetical protein EHM46_01990 [Bacteroidetes bacterium]|nr:MAG: hypothetical protein EHM46_01990 [Bacteroidota bacterium]